MQAQYWIDKLQLQPHPEGGFYKETYRAEGVIAGIERNYATAIYFLLPEGKFSAFHRIKSDEMWHFYAGHRLHIYVIDPKGRLQTYHLGNNIEQGEQFQIVVPAGCWFASQVDASQVDASQVNTEPTRYAIVGCTVAPGFDFRDFEMADRAQLIQAYPQHAALIRALTYDT